MQRLPIYLDYQATTPLDPRVRETLAEFDRYSGFGNPHSADHIYGWKAADAVREARAQVAQFIHADDDEIVFTSGATESCNIALRGAAKTANDRNEIVTLNTEHPAVLETARSLQEDGFILHTIPVERNGIVNLERLAEVVTEQTLIVSVMQANNEIGVLQPITEIAAIAHRQGALMHSDATQAAGRLSIDVTETEVDLLTLSSHKIYGPKGIGCLYVRDSILDRLAPITTGGGQELGLRPGTLPAALVAGLGRACEIATDETVSDSQRIQKLTLMLWAGLSEVCPGIRLHGDPEQRISGNLNVAFPNISGQEIVARMQDEIAIATGSACSSEGTDPSHVITALKFAPEEALGAIRISLGRFTTEEEIKYAIQVFRTKLGHETNIDNPTTKEVLHV